MKKNNNSQSHTTTQRNKNGKRIQRNEKTNKLNFTTNLDLSPEPQNYMKLKKKSVFQ